MAPAVVVLADEEATARLGAALALRLAPGMLVLLRGELGAGKTALARAVVRARVGDPRLEVPSPSFALVQPYEAGSGSVLHADLFRLSDRSETRELGLFDDPDAIVLVEWPERDPALMDAADLVVTLETGEGETMRRATLASPRGSVDCSGLGAPSPQ